LRTGDEGTIFLAMAIIGRELAASAVRRAPTVKWAPTSLTGRTRADPFPDAPLLAPDAPLEPAAAMRGSRVPGGSDAQALAALGAARADHGTTAASLHTHEEAVSALAANHRRLVCAFHGLGRFRKKPAITSKQGAGCQ
jgi:hypothetical protein